MLKTKDTSYHVKKYFLKGGYMLFLDFELVKFRAKAYNEASYGF